MAIVTTISRALNRMIQHLDSLLRSSSATRLLRTRPRVDEALFAAYFADTLHGLYQIGQWLPALERLAHDVSPVLLIVKDPHVAQLLAARTQLSIVLAKTSSAVEQAIRSHRTRAVFYVNNNQANFTVLRINGPAHIHLSHGESGKTSMVSNQLKAYDFVFVAGNAAVDRIMANIPRFDPSHLVRVGRPQLDGIRRMTNDLPSSCTVMYGPTWEGDSPQMAYGSVASIGGELIRTLLADPTVRVIYRPHPKTGQNSKSYADAHNEIRSLMRSSSDGRAVFDTSQSTYDSLAKADVFVGDVSAMTMDSIGLGIPTVLCRACARPADSNPSTGDEASDLLEKSVPVWSGQLPSDIIDQLKLMARSGPTERQLKYREYVFGPEGTSATDMFISASIDAVRTAQADWPATRKP